jgi:hypothetical protein
LFEYSEYIRKIDTKSIVEEDEKLQMAQIFLERATCYYNILKDNNENLTFLTEEEKKRPDHKKKALLKKLNHQITLILVEDLKEVVAFHPPFRSKCDKLYDDLKKIIFAHKKEKEESD